MESLVERVKTADELACKELYEQFSKPMYNLCLRMMNHEQDALDVLQGLLCQDFSKYWSIGAGVLTSSLDKKNLCEYMPSNN
jgi:DNA-directed RNA polymerase specialized sigma24 family protein